MRGLLLWLLLVGGAFWYTPSAARQLFFEKQREGEFVKFSYRYQGNTQRTEALGFVLSHEAIEASESMLLNNADLVRAANNFVLLEAKGRAAQRLAELQEEFEASIDEMQRSIAIFNGRIGGKIVSMTLRNSKRLRLELSLSGENLLDIKVLSSVPGMKFTRNKQVLTAQLNADAKAIIAQTNASLPKEWRFVVVRETGETRFLLRKNKAIQDQGTRARANTTVSKSNARLRTRYEEHKQTLKEVKNFLEGNKERAKALIAETSRRLAETRKELIVEMKEEKSQFRAQHYLLRSKKNERRTLIDYPRIAQEALPRLDPVAQAFRESFEGKDEREQVATILHFFQNIPYNDLTKGKVRGFIGFAPPIEVIARNLGDCDSKTTAMMGILRLLLKDRSVALFLVPGHAFLGFEMKPQENDAFYTYQGKTYVLMEPTGPYVRPIGSLTESSAAHVQAGRIDEIFTLSPY